MGIGRYKNGKFDLIVSLRHDAGDERIDQWERSFRRASEILFDATDGQMQFGKIFVAKNSAGNDEADAWLLEDEGISSSSVNALGVSGLHMNLKSDEKNKPFIIIHEFGHYGFGLYDEYIGPDGSAECTGGTDQGACIMEHGYWNGDQIDDDGILTPGPINEFCTTENHDPDADTNQEAYHGESCWETIHDNYPDVDTPDGLPDAPIPDDHEDVEWILMAEDARFSMILDKSGSMSASNAISGVRFGADYWVRYLTQMGDSLSVIAYNQSQDVILPLTTLDEATDLTPTLTAIADISPGGATNIGGALQEGMDQILSPGERAATQVAILFSDGLHNTGINPDTVIGDLVENGVRVYTIGFGPYADLSTLQQIAENTGGRFEQIDAAPSSGDAQLEIQNYLIEVSGEVRDGSGIVTMAPGLLPEPMAAERSTVHKLARLKSFSKPNLRMIAKMPIAFRPRARGFDHKAYIEAGCTRATFVVSYKMGTAVNFYLTAPDDQVVDPTSDTDVSFVNPGSSPYAFYVVNKPQAGYWIMRVVRGQTSGELPFKVFAFSENRNITIGLRDIRYLATVQRPVDIWAQVYHGVPLTGLRPPVATVTLAKPSTKTAVVGKPLKGLTKTVRLQEQMAPRSLDAKAGECPRTVRNGVYKQQLRFDKPGSYDVNLKFVNQGQATECQPEAECPDQAELKHKPKTVGAFTRVKRFQVHVGPLPGGKNVEGGDGPKPGTTPIAKRILPLGLSEGGAGDFFDISGSIQLTPKN